MTVINYKICFIAHGLQQRDIIAENGFFERTWKKLGPKRPWAIDLRFIVRNDDKAKDGVRMRERPNKCWPIS